MPRGRDLSGTAGQERGDKAPRLAANRIDREVARLSVLVGHQVREERIRRGLTIRAVAKLTGLGRATVNDIESGRVGSLESYVRLAEALRLKAEFGLVDPRSRGRLARRAVDPVHAVMGEAEATHFRSLGFEVGLDEPFQHYQFAGRADVVAWSVELGALLHIENRTRFPDLQESFGSFNAKRSYLGPELAARAGIAHWQSETHIIAALWSADVLRALRAHKASFASVCPGSVEGFSAWWRGEPPATGRRSILIIFDPAQGRRSDRRRWLGMGELAGARPRYRDYVDAVALLDLGSG